MENLLLFSGISLPRNLGTRLLMNTLAFIVSLLYSLIGIVLQVVFAVANLDTIPMFEKMYQEMQDRFYIIIGIVMLFKVSMSMITYFANPDKLTDKEAGMGKVVTRMITVLILLIFVPTFVFPFLSRLQMPLLNTVGKVVLQTDGGLDHERAHMQGEQIATVLLGGFFTLRDESCGEESAELGTNIVDAITNLSDEACSSDKKTFKYDFDFVGALLAIIPILVISIIIGVQVAIRAFKLIILKLIAPIPIIYYMDPKSMKDGGKTSAYMKLFMTTYLDLFLHFGALFLVVEFINKLSEAWAGGKLLLGTIELAAKTGIIGLVFVIIGLLLFAFQAPKFVKKALGLKDSEFGAGLAGLLSTGAAMAGAVGSGVAGFTASKAATGAGHFIQNFGAAASSAIRGGAAGIKAAGDKGDFTKVLGAIKDKNALMAAERAAGSTGLGRMKTSLASTFMGETDYDQMQKQLKDLKTKESTAKQLKEYMIGEGKKHRAGVEQSLKAEGHDFGEMSLDNFNALIDAANAPGGGGAIQLTDETGTTRSYSVNSSVVNKLKGDLEEGVGTLYAQAIDDGLLRDDEGRIKTDSVLEGYRKSYLDNSMMTATEKAAFIAPGADGGPSGLQSATSLKKAHKSAASTAFNLENSETYAKAKANAQMTGKK